MTAGPGPDWRDPLPYAPIVARGRPALAWELLRRDPAYRAAYAVAGGLQASCAAVWGLHFPF